MRYRVEAMRLEHIPTVHQIEKRCFPQPWPQNAYRREIQNNRMAHYFVVRRVDDSEAASTEATPPPEAANGTGGDGGLLGKLSRMFRGSAEQTPSPAA